MARLAFAPGGPFRAGKRPLPNSPALGSIDEILNPTL